MQISYSYNLYSIPTERNTGFKIAAYIIKIIIKQHELIII